jgi:glycosyltransferase involved in cell wall biosynthesis
MKAPLVSVIIPVYNGERFLGDALRSVMAQDYRPIEVLVIDDGSIDGSAEIAQGFSDVRYFRQANHGAPHARNLGLAQARGDLVALLDADDLWLPGKLSLQVRYLEEHPEARFVLTRQRVFLEPGISKPAWVKQELLAHDSVGYLPSTLLARKSLFDEIGGFDTRVPLNDDVEWFFRVKAAGIPMGVVPEVLLHKRVHDSNLGYQTGAGQRELLDVIRTSIRRRRNLDA